MGLPKKLDIEKYKRLKNYNITHAVLKLYLALFGQYFWYKKTHYINKGLIPKDKPIIFVANHQNALLDAMALQGISLRQIVFIARADIFSNKYVASFLRMGKMMPIFRPRDGKENMQANHNTFAIATTILRNNRSMVVFAEGGHDKYRRLRTLKKGIGRIAFMAEAETDFTLDLHIVPVGIDYSHYYKTQHELVVKFGKPIRMADYKASFTQNQGKALNTLRNNLTKAIKPLMVHIETQKHYEAVDTIRNLMGTRLCEKNCKRPQVIEKQQEIIKALAGVEEQKPEKMDQISAIALVYNKHMRELKLREWLFSKKKHSKLVITLQLLLALVLLPLHLYGMLNNYLAYKIPEWVSDRVKDEAFKSTFRYILSLFTFPIFYTIQHNLFKLLPLSHINVWFYTFSLPITGIITFKLWILSKKLIGKLRYNKYTANQNKNFAELKETRHKLIEFTQHSIKLNK